MSTDHEQAIPRFPLAWPSGWTRTLRHRRVRATFSSKKALDGRVSVFNAITRLEGELTRLGATNAVLSTNVALRLDGRPRSDQEPDDVGAAVYFAFKGRATVFACDKWNRVADNIAAIAAHVWKQPVKKLLPLLVKGWADVRGFKVTTADDLVRALAANTAAHGWNFDLMPRNAKAYGFDLKKWVTAQGQAKAAPAPVAVAKAAGKHPLPVTAAKKAKKR